MILDNINANAKSCQIASIRSKTLSKREYLTWVKAHIFLMNWCNLTYNSPNIDLVSIYALMKDCRSVVLPANHYWFWLAPFNPVILVQERTASLLNPAYCNSNSKISARFENQALNICKAYYYVWNSWILLAGTGVRKISSVACGFSYIKIHYSVNRINED